MPQLTQLPPLSLYVHIPWCVKKCPYCDFNSHAQRESLPEAEYIAALLADLESELPGVWGRRLHTIFIGGGTPSLFSPESIEQLLSGIRSRLPLSPLAEITMEANPGTLDNAKLAGFYQAGINRLSIGVQSFQPAQLSALGRIHSGEEATLAMESARQAGFTNVNLDLMFGLPGQDLTAARKDLETAISLKPEHLSYYQLTLEPNTAFYQQPPVLPHDDACWDIQQQGMNLLAAAGYQQYEVSAYAQAGQQAKHNINYWQFGDYIGIGAGAHGKISNAQFQTIERRWKHKHPKQYLETAPSGTALAGQRLLETSDRTFEFLMNALRLRNGCTIDTYVQSTALSLDELHPQLDQAIKDGLMLDPTQTGRLQTTEQGYLFLNELLTRFIQE